MTEVYDELNDTICPSPSHGTHSSNVLIRQDSHKIKSNFSLFFFNLEGNIIQEQSIMSTNDAQHSTSAPPTVNDKALQLWTLHNKKSDHRKMFQQLVGIGTMLRK